jgi:signal transduction histidine kinase
LILLIPLIIGSLIITSIVSLQNIAGIRAKFVDIFETSGLQLAERLSEEVRKVTIDLSSLSSDLLLRNKSISNSYQVEILRSSLNSSDSKYTNIAVYDLDGRLIIDTANTNTNESFANEEFIERASEGHFFFDSRPTQLSHNQSGFHFSAPIYDTNRTIMEILDIEIPVTFIDNLLNDSLFYGIKNNEPFRFDVELLHNNNYLIYSKSSLDRGIRDLGAVSERFDTLKDRLHIIGDTMVMSIPLLLGEDGYNTNGNWTLVLTGDLSSIMNDYNKTVSDFLISSALILIITIFVTVLTIRKITSPITQLKNSALELSKNNFGKEIMVEGSSEVKDLSITLEVMRRNIENSKKNLIQKVKERTKELERANEELRAKETEVNNINIELRKSTRAKEEFLSMVSHELKTPITPMKLYIEMILKEDKSNNLTDFQKKGLNIVYKNIIKLETIINDIFTVYKMESDNFALNKEVISVEELVETNVSALKPLMKDKEIDLNVVVATNSSIYCDPNRISQVLFNLVNNAVDHVPDKNGRITIEVEKQNIIEKSDSVSYGQNGTQDKIVFTIEDNGIGIKEENIPGLFKKFYQIDTGLRRKYGGTGLGLAICKGIIESHGGSIWLDSTYKDGARFKFTLDAF